MYFDFPAFIKYNFISFFRTRGQQYRLTPKRFTVLFIWLMLYIPAQIINRFFFLLDEVFYSGYRRQKVEKPVFIIGNPRSGTTFLHRLIYLDQETFTSFSVWELFFAPSVTQRKLILGVKKILTLAGYPVKRIANRINKRMSIDKSAHKITLSDAEEDEHILIHAWSSETLWPLYPIKEEIMPYFFFDRDIPEKQKNRIMRFYESMLKRHLFAYGGKKRFLSKNPSHTGKIAALQEYFPDARFINLARNPYEVMPSMVNYMAAGWKVFCDPIDPYPYNDEFFKVMNYYYLYPVEYFNQKPDDCLFIKYDNLLKDPESMISFIYDWLHLKISEKFAATIKIETEKAKNFVSKHHYDMNEMGLNEERIFSEFDEVFSYYEFELHDQELPDRIMLWQLRDWRKNWKHQRMENREKRIEKKKARKESRKQKKMQSK